MGRALLVRDYILREREQLRHMARVASVGVEFLLVTVMEIAE